MLFSSSAISHSKCFDPRVPLTRAHTHYKDFYSRSQESLIITCCSTSGLDLISGFIDSVVVVVVAAASLIKCSVL